MENTKQSMNARNRLLVWLLMMGLAFALNWPYLDSGFTGDEVVLIKAMKQDPLPYSRWRGAWSGDCTDLALMGNPWWAEEGAMGNFFRPIPSLAIEGSVKVFGENAFPLHLLSILLHGAIGFMVFLIAGRLTNNRFVSVLAGIIYIICEDHSMGVGYISFGTDLFCVFFIALALLFHLSWLKKRKPLSLILSLLSIAAALGCKETAAAAPLVLAVTSFFFPQGEADTSFGFNLESLKKRFAVFFKDFLSWLPAIGLLVVFLILYKGLNLGGMNSLTYIDPAANPGRYLEHLVIHLPIMWLAALTPISPGMGLFYPGLIPIFSFLGWPVFLVFLWVLWSFRKNATAVWAFSLFLLTLLPQMGTDAGERGLYFPFVFLSILFALIVVRIPFISRRFQAEPINVPRSPFIVRSFGWYLILVVILMAAVLSAMYPFMYIKSGENYMKAPLAAARLVEPNQKHIMILNTKDFFSLILLDTLLENETKRQLDVHVLSSHRAQVELEKVSETSFILRMDRKGWLTNMLAGAFRKNETVAMGEVYSGALFDATLLKVLDDGTDVLAVRFDVHHPLNDPGILFLYWNGKTFVPIDIAAQPQNKSIRLNQVQVMDAF